VGFPQRLQELISALLSSLVQENAPSTGDLEARVAGLAVAGPSQTTDKSSGGASPSPAPSAGGASSTEDERGALEKKLRALKKKVRCRCMGFCLGSLKYIYL
jgi:hypothetical protein